MAHPFLSKIYCLGEIFSLSGIVSKGIVRLPHVSGEVKIISFTQYPARDLPVD